MRSAFYWRENMAKNTPGLRSDGRRTPEQVKFLVAKAMQMKDEGLDTKQIAQELGCTRDYAQALCRGAKW